MNREGQWRVVTQFNQSGVLIRRGWILTVVFEGHAQQHAVEFENNTLSYGQGHYCSGYVPSGNGLWIYKHLLNENCVPHDGTPSWEL